MKPLKEKISITIDADILKELREQAEADEEGSAEDGIARDEGHGGEAKEEDRHQRHGQPEFFIKQVFHGMPPSRVGSSLLPGFRLG